jgi:ketosteroid isomerase-like protein
VSEICAQPEGRHAACGAVPVQVGYPNEAGVTREADGAAIRTLENRWREVVAKRDSAAIGSFYTADGIYAPDNALPFRGRDSVSARWDSEFGLPDFQLERTATRIEVSTSGEMAQEVGTYVVRLIRKDKPYVGRGNYMTAWRKVDGDWKIASYMWNAHSHDPFKQ